jgi:hypothetical protein
MQGFRRDKASDRNLRLFAVACCRRIWHLLPDERSRKAVEVAERFADGQSSRQERVAASAEAEDAIIGVRGQGQRAYFAAVAAGEVVAEEECDQHCGWYTASMVASNPTEEGRHQAGLVHDIFGDPFRPPPHLPHAVLAWNGGTVRRLAQAIYEERHLPEGTLDTARLAVLADALMDAGCDDEQLIRHCRSEGPHVRGCWAVDLILGKS